MIVVSQEALGSVSAEVGEIVARVEAIRGALAAAFSALANDPRGYGPARAELDKLDDERRALTSRLGELALGFLRTDPADALIERAERAETPTPALGMRAVVAAHRDLAARAAASDEANDSERDDESKSESDAESAPVRVPSPPPSAPLRFSSPAASSASDAQRRGRDDRGILASLADHVEIARTRPSSVELQDEIDGFERATADARTAHWRKLSSFAQAKWLSVLVAWGKSLEEEAAAMGASADRVRAGFGRLRAYSIEETPGYVHGFARNAVPEAASWRASAVARLEALVPRAAVKSEEAPRPPKSDEGVRAKKADAREASGEIATADDGDAWAFLDRTKGKRAVMLGGEVREDSRVALEEALQLEELEWVPHDRPRLLASLSARAASGTIDFVLVNKFVAHKETAALQRASETPIILIRHGYGVTAVRAALEEHFSRAASNA